MVGVFADAPVNVDVSYCSPKFLINLSDSRYGIILYMLVLKQTVLGWFVGVRSMSIYDAVDP